MKHYGIDEFISLQIEPDTNHDQLIEHLQTCKQCRDDWELFRGCTVAWQNGMNEFSNHDDLWNSVCLDIDINDYPQNKLIKIKKRIAPVYVNFAIAIASVALLFWSGTYEKIMEVPKVAKSFSLKTDKFLNETNSLISKAITDVNRKTKKQ